MNSKGEVEKEEKEYDINIEGSAPVRQMTLKIILSKY